MKKIGLIIFLLIILTSCSSKKTQLSFPTNEIKVGIGETVNVNLDVQTNKKNYQITYQLSNPIATIDNEGNLVAKELGETILTATLNNKKNTQASLKITICNIYHISFDLDGGKQEQDTIKFLEGDNVILPTPTKEGYNFLGWYQDNQQITSITNQNYQLQAKWEFTGTKAFFKDEQGNLLFTEDHFSNETISLKPLTKEGYEFIGWYINNQRYETYTMTDEDVTFVAKFKKIIKVTIDFNNDQEPVEYQIFEGTSFNQISIDIPSYNGYKFYSFYYNQEMSFEIKPNQKINSDLLVYAKWLKIYQITYELNGGTTSDDLVTEFTSDEIVSQIKLPIPNKKGYFFRGWFDNPSFEGTSIYKITEDNLQDFNLYAKWVKASLDEAYVSIIGDSISAFEGILPKGYAHCYCYTKTNGCLTLNDMWWKILQSEIGYKQGVVNAYAGTTVMKKYHTSYATENLTRLKQSVPANLIGPDIIVLFIGANDSLVSDVSITEFEKSYRNMIENIYSILPNVQIFIGNLAYEKYYESKDGYQSHLQIVENINQLLSNLAKEYELPLINFKDAYDKDTDDYNTLYDTIHPTALGQRLLATKAIEAFKTFYQLED